MEIVKRIYQGLSYDTYLVQLSPAEFDLSNNELIDICDRGRFNYGGTVKRLGLSGRAEIEVYRD
jgi:hypothetical protein